MACWLDGRLSGSLALGHGGGLRLLHPERLLLLPLLLPLLLLLLLLHLLPLNQLLTLPVLGTNGQNGSERGRIRRDIPVLRCSVQLPLQPRPKVRHSGLQRTQARKHPPNLRCRRTKRRHCLS